MQVTNVKRFKKQLRLVVEDNPVEILQETESYQTTNWYMHKLESVLENETHKNLWDLEILKDPSIYVRSDLDLIKEK